MKLFRQTYQVRDGIQHPGLTDTLLHRGICLRAVTSQFPGGRTSEVGMAQESEEERWRRNFNELLQELRVAQTGVQILFAFLLTLVFTARFGELSAVQKNVYLVALLSAAGAVSMIIAPVAYHRMLFRQRRKPEIVRIAHRMASAGLAFLLVSMVSSIYLVVEFMVNRAVAAVVTAVVGVWFALWWGVLPWLRRDEPDSEGGSEPTAG
jgi:putative flippase GtrA